MNKTMMSVKRSVHGVLLCVGVLSIVAPGEAVAYRQTKTCLTNAQRDPEAPTNLPNCAIGQVGWPVRWPARTIPYMVNRKGHDAILPSVDGQINPEVLSAVRAALSQWEQPGCSDFSFKYEGLTDVDAHAPEDGVNVITWVGERWAETSATIALTSTTMTQKGVLVDADMEFNVRAHRFTISTPTGSGAMDLANTATHEAGHMLGLDEAPSKDATMYYSASTEEINKRDLYADDVAGLCAIYPQGVPPVNYEELGEDMGDGGGSDGGCCSTVTTGAAGELAARQWLALCILGGVWGWRRRRRA